MRRLYVRISEVLTLNYSGAKSELREDCDERQKRRARSNDTEVRRHQQAGEHDQHRGPNESLPEPASNSPAETGNGARCEITRPSLAGWIGVHHARSLLTAA